MLISDWRSTCALPLKGGTEIGGAPQDDAGACCGDQAADYQRPHTPAHEGEGYADNAANDIGDYATRSHGPVAEIAPQLGEMDGGQALQRSQARTVGKRCGRTCRYRGSP